MLANLSEDREAARRIAFVMGRMAVKLGLPAGSGAEALLQGAMERPEAVAPEEFKIAYGMRSTAAGIAWSANENPRRSPGGRVTGANRVWSEGSL
jgi:hypothetical protein